MSLEIPHSHKRLKKFVEGSLFQQPPKKQAEERPSFSVCWTCQYQFIQNESANRSESDAMNLYTAVTSRLKRTFFSHYISQDVVEVAQV